MATITANSGSNNWNTNGAWTGGVQPTAADDVIIPSSATIIIPSGITGVCRSFSMTGTGAITFAATSSTLNIGTSTPGAGNVAINIASTATITLTAIGSISLISTSTTQQTISTGGKTLPNLVINGSGSSYIMTSSLTSSGTIMLTTGTFNTGNYAITAGVFSSNNSNTRTLTLGSSSITLNMSNTNTWVVNSTNLTITANTATVTLTGTGGTIFNSQSSTDYNGLSVVFTGALVSGGFSGPPGMTMTLKNVTITGTAVTTNTALISGPLVCTGTFTVTGNSAVNRVLIFSSVLGSTRTITAASTALSNVDFMDISGAGTGAWSASSGVIGDRLGNTNITFTTPTTQTRDSVSGQAWSVAARWTSRVPLPQDDVVLNASSGSISGTDVPVLGNNINAAGYAGTITATSTNTPFEFYGNISLGGTFTAPNTFYLHACGRSSHTITSNGNVMWGGANNGYLRINTYGGTYTLADALIALSGAGSNAGLLVNSGTFDSANYSMAIRQFNSNTTTTRTVNLRNSIITSIRSESSSSPVVSMASTGLTWLGSSASWIIQGVTTYNSSGTRTWVGGGLAYGPITFTDAFYSGVLAIADGGNTFASITINANKGLRLQSSNVNTFLTAPVLQPSPSAYIRTAFTTERGAWITTPDSSALSITGDIDIRARLAMDDWTPSTDATVVSKWDTNGQRSYMLQISSTGNIKLLGSPTGTGLVAVASLSAVSFADGQVGWIRATYEQSSKDVKFYTAPDSTSMPVGAGWTQLGSTRSGLGPTSFFDSTAAFVISGYDRQSGGTIAILPVSGKFYRVQLRNNLNDDSTGIAFDADFATKQYGANSFTESSINGATVTFEGLAMLGDGRVQLDSSTAGSVGIMNKPSGGPVSIDQCVIKDFAISQPLNFFAGLNSVDGGNNPNIEFSTLSGIIHKQSATNYSTSATTISATFPEPTTSGHLLVAFAGGTGTPGTVTPPTGFIEAISATGASSLNRIYYKIADGTESTVSFTQTNATNMTIHILELYGISATPSLDGTSYNSAPSASTSLSTTSTTGPTNTAQPAIALAFLQGTNTLNSSSTPANTTNSFLSSYDVPYITGARSHLAIKKLLSLSEVSTTFSWTTGRTNTMASLAVFKYVESAINNGSGFLLFM